MTLFRNDAFFEMTRFPHETISISLRILNHVTVYYVDILTRLGRIIPISAFSSNEALMVVLNRSSQNMYQVQK